MTENYKQNGASAMLERPLKVTLVAVVGSDTI